MATPGQQLRARILSEFEHNGTEPDERESEAIDLAAATADTIDQLEALLAADGPSAIGSSGQMILHPAIAELRQQRQVLHRLLSGLDFVGDGTANALSAAARHSAAKRWRGKSHRQVG